MTKGKMIVQAHQDMLNEDSPKDNYPKVLPRIDPRHELLGQTRFKIKKVRER